MHRTFSLWLAGALLLGCLPFVNVEANTNPSDTPITVYQVLLESTYTWGGSTSVSADSTPASTTTTGAAYPDGVHLVTFSNSSANEVKVTWDGTDASDTNYNLLLPAGMGFTAVSRSKISTLSLYAASASTVYIAW